MPPKFSPGVNTVYREYRYFELYHELVDKFQFASPIPRYLVREVLTQVAEYNKIPDNQILTYKLGLHLRDIFVRVYHEVPTGTRPGKDQLCVRYHMVRGETDHIVYLNPMLDVGQTLLWFENLMLLSKGDAALVPKEITKVPFTKWCINYDNKHGGKMYPLHVIYPE